MFIFPHKTYYRDFSVKSEHNQGVDSLIVRSILYICMKTQLLIALLAYNEHYYKTILI